MSRDAKPFQRLKRRLRLAKIIIHDEFSMTGKIMLGKCLYRADNVKDPGLEGSFAGVDVVLAGHLAQAAPIGDDAVYKVGPYTGKGENKPPEGSESKAWMKTTDFVNKANVFFERIRRRCHAA